MTAAQDFKALSTRLADSDHGLWLGRLAWYGVTDVLVPHTKLVQALAANNLSAYIPRLPSDVDVFRRICTSSQRRREPTSNPDIYENYLIRDIPMDADYVYKVLVKETVAPGSLNYETELCTLKFHKVDSSLTVHCRYSDAVANQIVTEVQNRYHAERGTLNSYAVRELLRRIMLGLNAVNVRGAAGGVYFVGEQHGQMLDSLEAFAAAMPGSVLFHTLPLLDDFNQRGMLKRAFESETVEGIERLVNEIADLEKAGKPITSDRVAAYMRQLDGLKAKTKEYMDLLDDSTDTAKSSLGIFQRQILKLSTLVPA